MKDKNVRWLKISLLSIVLMYVLQIYYVDNIFRIAMVQTGTAPERITMLMRSISSRNEKKMIMETKSELDSRVLAQTGSLNRKQSKTEVYILLRKENVSQSESSSANNGVLTEEKRALHLSSLMSKKIVYSRNISATPNGTAVYKPLCSPEISNKSGKIGLQIISEKNYTLGNTRQLENDLSNLTKTVEKGGRYQPSSCISKEKVAIIIPFRDREEHLKIFLRHIHPFLQRQNLEYGIYVIELAKNISFNRAILMNIGFFEALKLHSYTCFVFHDVDLLPENDRIPYSCASNPQHLSVAVNTLNYTLPNEKQFGGVTALRREQFLKVNGMSNMFFGWGGEDDDLSERIRINNFNISRPPVNISRYTMIGHVQDTSINLQRRCLLKSVKDRMTKDGLVNLKYDRLRLEFRPLYAWVLVSVNKTEQIGSDRYLFKIYDNCVQNKRTFKTLFIHSNSPIHIRC